MNANNRYKYETRFHNIPLPVTIFIQGRPSQTSANYLKLFRLSIFCDRLSLKSFTRRCHFFFDIFEEAFSKLLFVLSSIIILLKLIVPTSSKFAVYFSRNLYTYNYYNITEFTLSMIVMKKLQIKIKRQK